MKLKLTKKEREYFAAKGAQGGKKGGKKGGKSRMASLTPEQRSELARKAGRASAAAKRKKDAATAKRKERG